MSSHSIICAHGPLVDLSRHSHNIARFLICENVYDNNPVTDWLKIASGIVSVKYVSDMFDENVMWCGPAIEYENAKSDFHSRLIKELTRFSFIWGGFEAFLDTLELPRCPGQRGKINDVNFFLKNHFENIHQLPLYYTDVTNYLRTLIGKNQWYGEIDELFSVNNCSSENVIGLKVVYKIRNKFAHGGFQFSEPDGWNDSKPYDIQIIVASSRVILLSMQMLIKCVYKDLSFNVCEPHESQDEEGVAANEFIENLHIKALQKTHI